MVNLNETDLLRRNNFRQNFYYQPTGGEAVKKRSC